jgi:hypothetical protein
MSTPGLAPFHLRSGQIDMIRSAELATVVAARALCSKTKSKIRMIKNPTKTLEFIRAEHSIVVNR